MKELVCIVCPNGCTLHIEEDGKNIKVSGQKCRKGLTFAQNEMTNPMRTICSTVRTAFESVPVLPVKVSCEIPKDKIFEVMQEINRITVHDRIGTGDIIIKNVCGTAADIIATSNILKE
ncbi:MAG: DUF1667 domain-containing protein [Ruminococcaceae bacterium]|nr:DUF1667 domain-containing protein [Oscillospiraceae bacterium]